MFSYLFSLIKSKFSIQITSDLEIFDFYYERVYYIGKKMVKKFKLNPYLLLIVSFLLVALLGSFLLSMPFAFRNNPNNEWCHGGSYIDAFFTSLSAMTLTGVTTYPQGLADTLSIPGQIIVLILVQTGGLGIVTILTFLFSVFGRRMQFKDRLMVSQAISFNNFGEIALYVRRLIIITAAVETLGIILGLPFFLQVFPNNPGKGIYYSIFYSVSAFNNAGFDLFSGTSSFVDGINAAGGVFISQSSFLYYYSTIYLAVLSLLGGISFLVIIEIILEHKPPRRWSAFTKICLTMTVGMIGVITLLIFCTEGFKANNPMTFYEALMQSINCRTAGFNMYQQDQISLPGRMICCVMMLVGGSPLSTAGGIKITTAFIIVLAIVSYFKGEKMSAFKRRYSYNLVAKSMSLVFLVVFFIFLAFIGLNVCGTKNVDGLVMSESIQKDKISFYLYEVFSCFGNVGVYTGLEPFLSPGSCLILCFIMLIGHLGPMAFFQLFQNNLDKTTNSHYSFVEEDFLIG